MLFILQPGNQPIFNPLLSSAIRPTSNNAPSFVTQPIQPISANGIQYSNPAYAHTVLDGANTPVFGPFGVENTELSTTNPIQSIKARKPRLFNAIKEDVQGDDYTAIALGSSIFTQKSQTQIPTVDHSRQKLAHKPPSGKIALNQSHNSIMSSSPNSTHALNASPPIMVSTTNNMESKKCREQLPDSSLESTALDSLGIPSTYLTNGEDSTPYSQDEGNFTHPIPEVNISSGSGVSVSMTGSRRSCVMSDEDDELDVVTKVMQPGASAQPLVNSIKLDLQQVNEASTA